MRFFDFGQEATGVIAVGQIATGVVAIGQFATGVIAIGQISRGVIAIGQMSLPLSVRSGREHAVAPATTRALANRLWSSAWFERGNRIRSIYPPLGSSIWRRAGVQLVRPYGIPTVCMPQ